MYSIPDHLRLLARQPAAQEMRALLPSAIARVAGHQHPRVPGKPLHLSLHAFTVLLLPAARAIESPGEYFSTEALSKKIAKRGCLPGELHLSWENPTGGDVHSAAGALRKSLAKQGLDRTLVESVHGKGCRLSTPAMNVVAVAVACAQRRRGNFAPEFAKNRDRSGGNPLPVKDVAKEIPLRDGARGSRHHHSIN